MASGNARRVRTSIPTGGIKGPQVVKMTIMIHSLTGCEES